MKDISPAVQKVLGVILLVIAFAAVSTYYTQIWLFRFPPDLKQGLKFEGVLAGGKFDALDRWVVWYPLTILPVALGFSLLVDIHETFLTYMAFAKWNFISWWISFCWPALPVWLLADARRWTAPSYIVVNLIVLIIAIGLPLIGYLDDEKRAFYKRIRLQD